MPVDSRARQLWMVRIPRGRSHELDARAGIIPVSLGIRGEITDILDLDDAIPLLEAENPSLTLRQIESRARALVDFSTGIMPGDLMLVHLRDSRSVLICMAGHGGMASHAGLPARLAEVIREVPEAGLPADLSSSMSAQQPVCRLRNPNALMRITHLLTHGVQPMAELPDPGSAVSGHDMAALIAAALRDDGYRCHISPPGPDGGADILAGKGMLGFEGSVVVQVKSGRITCGTAEIDRLLGVMHTRGASHGMIASWGGFTGPAMARATELWFKVRLWGREDIARAAGRAARQLEGDLAEVAESMAAWSAQEEPGPVAQEDLVGDLDELQDAMQDA